VCLEGGWTLIELLGIGGTAAVYRATHPEAGGAAVKLVHPHLAYDRDWVRRLRREAKLLRSIRHRGLVRLLEAGIFDGGSPFFVMELLAGRSLDALRKEAGGTLPLADTLGFASALLDVLAHTHALGVVHRDLKPSNLFVTNSGELKVLDFGIASGPAHEVDDGTARSSTRGILGTPAYMAPEQARGRWDLVDHRRDLWSVGATNFTLLSAQHFHLAAT
jgi:serine/threonine-protein kinase